jgi:hypothetical protein
MNFLFEFLDIHITHLAQLPMINMTLKCHHINICNKITILFHHMTCFLARLIMIAPIYDHCNCGDEIYQPIDYYFEEGFSTLEL